MTPEQLAAIEAWRANFHPDVLKWLEDGVKSAIHYKDRGASASVCDGMEALLKLARSLAVSGE